MNLSPVTQLTTSPWLLWGHGNEAPTWRLDSIRVQTKGRFLVSVWGVEESSTFRRTLDTSRTDHTIPTPPILTATMLLKLLGSTTCSLGHISLPPRKMNWPNRG